MNRKRNQPAGGYASFFMWVSISTLIIVLDQLTKWAIVKWVPYLDRVPVNAFINITHQRNTGAAFSFLADAGGWQRWFFIVLAFAVSIMIVVWLWRIRNERQLALAAGLALVLGGALGNVIDRVRLGYVVDFFQVFLGSWPFPSFNVADAAISVGAAFLIIDALFISGREPETPPKKKRRK